MNIAHQHIIPLISEAIEELQLSATSQSLPAPEIHQIHLEHPSDPQFGDYSTNVAMVLFRQLPQLPDEQKKKIEDIKTPRMLAEKIAAVLRQKIQANDQLLQEVSVAGPGFINFTLSNHFLLEVAKKVCEAQGDVIEQTGRVNVENGQNGQAKKVVVEFSSPNIAKPFTVGHLRTTIIGDAVAHLLEATGWQVFRDNHLGDWGTQFGKQIYAIKHFGSEQQIEESESPVKELVALYVKFHQEAEMNPEIEDEAREWFKRLEDGDHEARRLWKKCVEWSMKEFNRIYTKLGIHFTENEGRGFGESFFEDKMSPVIKELEEKNILKESEGAKLVFFPNDKFPPLMILKKDGATLYATRDLATDKFRLEKYGKDIVVINEVGAEQSLYLQQVFAVEEMLGWYKPGQRVHVKHGFYRFKDKKMSTRKGNVIWLEDVLQEAYQRVYQKSQEVLVKKTEVVPGELGETTSHLDPRSREADIWKIAIGALKWNDLKREAIKEIVFDWDEILSLQGNSGPYVQYTYARAKSVLERAASEKSASEKNGASLNPENTVLSALSDYQPNEEEKAVLRLMYQFSEVVERAAAEFAPHYLCTYLFELAQSFNTFYNKHSILQSENEATKAVRLALTRATSLILQKGLGILGIETVEKM